MQILQLVEPRKCNISCMLYVIRSRQVMPPDALQPKAYCTNPGL